MVTLTDAAMASLLQLRVDVQNVPRAALEAGRSGQLNLRVASDLSLLELKAALQERLATALDIPLAGGARVGFDVEVYDAKADRFEPLVAVHQLGRRSRLNIVLHKTDDASDAARDYPALPARLFAVDTSAGDFTINGVPVHIGEVENSGLGTGLTTWDGSVVLAKYLEHKYSRANGLDDARVLELGAGTGLVGLSAALIGGANEVTLTDLEYTMGNLERNIQRTMSQAPQSKTRVTAQVLDWFQPVTSFGDIDLILASDVVWVEELIAPLVATMHCLVRTSRVPTTILMSHQQRSVVSDAVLFSELAKRGFARRDVPRDRLHPDFVSDKISVWEIALI